MLTEMKITISKISFQLCSFAPYPIAKIQSEMLRHSMIEHNYSYYLSY